MLYLAYGSNLNTKEMSVRCPSAKFIGVGCVKGMELEFRYYLSVKENAEKELYVGVWDIDVNELILLDAYEGYPTLYDRKIIKFTDEKGFTNEGLIYFMMSNQYCINAPTSSYFSRCYEGYKNCNIPLKQLIDAYNNVKNRVM